MEEACLTPLPPDDTPEGRWVFIAADKKRAAEEGIPISSTAAKRATTTGPDHSSLPATGEYDPSQKLLLSEKLTSLPMQSSDTEKNPFIFPKVVAKIVNPKIPQPTATNNRFDSLTIEETNMDIDKTTTDNPETQSQTDRQLTRSRAKVGSIHVDNNGLRHPQKLLQDLQKTAPDGFYAKSTKKELVLQPRTPDSYRKLLKAIEDIEITPNLRQKYFQDNLYYHHHRMTEERRDRLVIKGLSPGIPLDEIKNELTLQNITYHHVSEMKRRNPDNSLSGLGLYIIETNKTETASIKTNLRHLLHYRVTVQDYNQTTYIPRCDNCQLLFHTKHYCHRQTICGKCSENHHTSTCPNDHFKCANCHNDHPSFSPDCPTLLQAKEDKLKNQQLRQTQTRQGQSTTPPSLQEFPQLRPSPSSRPTNPTQSYAHVTSNPSNPTSSTTSFSELKELFTLIKSCNLSQILSSIKAIIAIAKGPEDSMTKLISIATKIIDLF